MVNLLPGGKNGIPASQIGFAVTVIALGYQGFVNVHRYSAIAENIYSLGDELNVSGEAEYRRRLGEILDTNDVPVDASEIRVSLDEAKDAWVVTVPCRLSLGFASWRIQSTTPVQATIPRSHVPF